MRVNEMHPLCCISLESPAIGDGTPEPILLRTGSAMNFSGGGSDANAGESEISSSRSVAGILYKWTNYGKGWRSRWFTLRSNGVLSYSKTRRPEIVYGGEEVVFIGHVKAPSNSGTVNICGKHSKTVGTVHLKVSSFRESKSDERRFYIFTASKTLHLRTNTKKERAAWTQALISTRSISTKRLLEDGIGDGLVKDCEKIMLSEFSEYQSMKQEYSNLARGKYSEWSTTESPDDVDKQELEEASDEEEHHFFDTNDYFSEPTTSCESVAIDHMDSRARSKDQTEDVKGNSKNNVFDSRYPQIERRKRLPDPVEKERSISLWSIIKDNIGKDLTQVCLPVYFNEPISSLQKCFEDLEYSYLLDRAYEHGKSGNDLLRILYVAAFAVSGYASSEGRHCKPFNPLLGETYEADYPEKGVRFFSEKVSHHPTVIACHCEAKGWKFRADSNLKSKFWGRSIQLDPVGILTLEFDDGEIFQWSKVTTSIYNLILGNIYCDHHGTMHIRSNRHNSCKLKFKEQSFLERNPRQVHGFVEDVTGKKVATLFGKWDDSIYYINGEGTGKVKDMYDDASLLWKRNKPPPDVTRYNLTSFAITLNELTPGLKEKLPPTDSRLRPDQRYLENGEYDKANEEKMRLEMRQRMSRKLQENGWQPRWFQRDFKDGSFRYMGGYWEAREQGKWDICPNIFGEISEIPNSFEDS